MIDKSEMRKIIENKLIKVLTTKIIYQYSKYDISLNEILLKQSLQFSNPKTFNDPFDCNENLLKIHHSEKLIEDSLSSYSINLSRVDRRKIKRKLKNPTNLSEIIKRERVKFKISCFSELYNEVLMWSHYADKHYGICVGFEFPPKYEEKFIISPVTYLDKIVPIDGNSDMSSTILYWLTTKSVRWSYEKEIRAITKCISKEDCEYIKYDSAFVREIIFGCNVTDSKIIEAMNKIRKSNLNYNNIVFKRMKVDQTTFLLKEKLLKSNT